MKKRILFVITVITIVLLMVCLVSCNKDDVQEDVQDDKPYYGTYYGGISLNEKIVIDETFKWEDKEYEYLIDDNSISLLGRDTFDTFQRFEDGNVLSLGIVYSFDSGSINKKDGNFNANLCKFTSNLSIDYSYVFNNTGSYQFIAPMQLSYCHTGTYTLQNGVLTLNGTFVMGKSIKEIFYIESPDRLHYGVYVKDGFLSENNNIQNEPQNNNPPQNQDVFYNII